ncbi:alpha-E domain-containing protein, partial [Salmonella enterica]|nr:alpha-E domain-containing protein [Salmonella enterica]
MTSKYLNLAISPTKADRLFWLGRYAERASLSLHLIRRYCNIALDQSPADAMAEFARRMGVSADTTPAGTFVSEYLYSSLMPSSIASVLDSAKNNA